VLLTFTTLINNCYFTKMIKPEKNTFLIADPFLKDQHFIRSVIYLCSHTAEGSIGFSLHKEFDRPLSQLIIGLEDFEIPVYVGGPVETNTIHFLHQFPDLIPNSNILSKEICWGGDFNVVKKLITENKLDLQKIKFFIGYSGWGNGQLEDELNEKSWLTCEANRKIIFEISPNNIWKESVKLLGPPFNEILNYPIDPQLN
jgi:putative transcriptional regulator